MNESLIDFPAEVTVRAMGLSHDDFIDTVSQLVHPHIEQGQQCDVKANKSSKGKYTSVSVTFVAKDQKHLEAVYASLHCLLYTSPSPRDATLSRMPSSA